MLPTRFVVGSRCAAKPKSRLRRRSAGGSGEDSLFGFTVVQSDNRQSLPQSGRDVSARAQSDGVAPAKTFFEFSLLLRNKDTREVGSETRQL